jgi:hypothetical protein
VVVDETPRLVEAGGGEFTVLTPVKARPVLLITEPSGHYGEVLALRLRRFSRLADAEKTAVRSGEVEDLFHLDPERCPGLDEENAAIVTTALRLPVSALDMARRLGQIDGKDVRVLHERFARAHRLDLRGAILGRAQELVASLAR